MKRKMLCLSLFAGNMCVLFQTSSNIDHLKKHLQITLIDVHDAQTGLEICVPLGACKGMARKATNPHKSDVAKIDQTISKQYTCAHV